MLIMLLCMLLPKEGSAEEDSFWGAVAGDNASVILVGLTHGNWSGTNHGGGDFAAVKLDADGSVLWRWQVQGKYGVISAPIRFCLFLTPILVWGRAEFLVFMLRHTKSKR